METLTTASIIKTIKQVARSPKEPKWGTLELGILYLLGLYKFHHDVLSWLQLSHAKFLIMLMMLIFLLLSTYMILFWFKYKHLINLTPQFGVYWDSLNNPYCPNCKTLLTNIPNQGYGLDPKCKFKCPNKHCINPELSLRKPNGMMMTLEEAIKLRAIKS